MFMKVSASPKVARMPGVAREKARAASSRRKASSCASMTARTARASSGGTPSWAAARCDAKARSSAPRKRVMIISDAEQLPERSRRRADRLFVGALLGLVLRRGKAVACAAVDLVLEGELRAAHLLDQPADRRERKALVLGAVQDQEHALRVRRPSGRAVAERAVYRDVRSERRAGSREFDAYAAAEAVADERDPGGIDHRVPDEDIERRLGPRAHQRAVLVVDRDLRLHFGNVLRQHALAVAEHVGGERDVAELGPDLRERLRFRRHALARMNHQHGGPPAGHLVVVDQIGFELGAALAVFDPLVLYLGVCRAGGERDGGGQKGCAEYRHGSLPALNSCGECCMANRKRKGGPRPLSGPDSRCSLASLYKGEDP